MFSGELRGGEIRAAIAAIASNFSNFQCDQCALAIQQALVAQGIRGQVIRVETGSNKLPLSIIFDRTLGEQIATNGFHEGIAVQINGQSIVFDNIHPNGMVLEDWLGNLDSPILYFGRQFIIQTNDF